ncbi:hypothetical protein V8G54_016665 [Vigna mungo]|uniref:RNA helicase n=1 Tax=Vigna mungo TaxID=3915 RepID=A0AAQ3NKM4_VIGMU
MLLYGAIFGCLSPILSIAAFLSYKSPFVYPKDERQNVERAKLTLLNDKIDGPGNTNDIDRQSDHLLMMTAYKRWQRILTEKGAKAAQKFCSSVFLNSSVMFMIRTGPLKEARWECQQLALEEMRMQFGTLLADIGLITLPKDYQKHGKKIGSLDNWLSDASQPFNIHAHHLSVLKVVTPDLNQFSEEHKPISRENNSESKELAYKLQEIETMTLSWSLSQAEFVERETEERDLTPNKEGLAEGRELLEALKDINDHLLWAYSFEKEAILCAGLYPNVAAGEQGIVAAALSSIKQSSSSANSRHTGWFDGRREVHIHPSSINSNSKVFQYPFLVFLEKVETNKVFLRDTTVISPYSILLFGGSINVQHQTGQVIIDGWLKLTAPAQVAVLFKELRLALHSIMKELIRKPEVPF